MTWISGSSNKFRTWNMWFTFTWIQHCLVLFLVVTVNELRSVSAPRQCHGLLSNLTTGSNSRSSHILRDYPCSSILIQTPLFTTTVYFVRIVADYWNCESQILWKSSPVYVVNCTFANAAKRRIRLYSCPQRQNIWRTLLSSVRVKVLTRMSFSERVTRCTPLCVLRGKN